jgi:hypothetical protein
LTSNGYHDTGEEWSQKHTYRQDQITRDASVDVLLYDDSADALTDSSDIGDITTEPTTGNYSRVSLSLDNSDLSLDVDGGNLRVQGLASFDTDNTTETVDAYAVAASFTSEVVNSEGSPNEHLIFSATLDGGSEDLSGVTTFDVEINGVLD